jgi:hypothetical protein
LAFLVIYQQNPSQHYLPLVAKIKEVMGNLDRDTVAKAYRCFWIRIEELVEAYGDFSKYNVT